MAAIVLTYFRMIAFPHKCGIVAIDQLTLFSIDSLVTGSVPLVGEPLTHISMLGLDCLRITL